MNYQKQTARAVSEALGNNMKVIYEPKGRAKEYAELACNLYVGCTHGCKYCYAPGVLRKTRFQWEHEGVAPRKDMARDLEKDLMEMCAKQDQREVLFSFVSDPFCCAEKDYRLTRRAITLCGAYNINHTVLTKGDYNLVSEYFDDMKKWGTRLGVSLCYVNDKSRYNWEPLASTVKERMQILKEAHQKGIKTWCSLEPVIYTKQALDLIDMMHPYVDFWKVGKLNHFKEIEDTIDWERFLYDVTETLEYHCCNYYIKNDLQKFGSIMK